MTEANRRETDDSNDEIGKLIKQENDPERRAFLLILQNINLSLVSNTNSTQKIEHKLNQHLLDTRARNEAQDALFNKGRGMWKVISTLIGFAQCAIFGILGYVITELKDINHSLALHNTRITVLEVKEQNKPVMAR